MESASRPADFVERYRLYLDESGDHVYRDFSKPSHRFLCLLGCWFKNPDYLEFHSGLETLKTKHLPHHPDNPVVLHREDMVNARKEFKVLRDGRKREAFDTDLLDLIQSSKFSVVAVVVDKAMLQEKFGELAGHPYHIGLGFLLQRYAGYLNHINRVGDVMGEARGGVEDRLLKDSYVRVFEKGLWGFTPPSTLQTALTSRELKLKPKTANISGLQLADLVGHPTKNWVLRQSGLIEDEPPPFAERLMDVIRPKFNRQLYTGEIAGYGYVVYPKK
jgi:hypothetical protein